MMADMDERDWWKQMEQEYRPCNIGTHLCGQIEDEDGERPLTLGNIPARTHDDAKNFWEAAKQEFGTEDGDVCVDLNLGTKNGVEHVDDFMMWRQMIPRLKTFAEERGFQFRD